MAVSIIMIGAAAGVAYLIGQRKAAAGDAGAPAEVAASDMGVPVSNGLHAEDSPEVEVDLGEIEDNSYYDPNSPTKFTDPDAGRTPPTQQSAPAPVASSAVTAAPAVQTAPAPVQARTVSLAVAPIATTGLTPFRTTTTFTSFARTAGGIT